MTAPVILPDAEALAASVATTLLLRVHDAQARGEEPHLCLTGGTIAGHVHRELARRTPGAGVDWSRMHLWWGDERFVARDSEERNARMAREDLLDHVDVDPAKVHEVPAAEDCADVSAAAHAYGAELREHGAGEFEVVMLGLGEDGHVASLFPGAAQLHVEDRVAVAVTGSPKPPPERVSLTFGALRRARAVWFLVSGEGKAGAVAAALDGATVEEIPAVGVTGRVETLWHLDQAAAGAL